MTDEVINQIEKRANAATSGPWYAKATDDEVFSNARYVSLVPGEFCHDNKRRLAETAGEKIESEKVVAITLLQNPDLAGPYECDENTEFIACAREDIPLLIGEVRRLKARIAELETEG